MKYFKNKKNKRTKRQKSGICASKLKLFHRALCGALLLLLLFAAASTVFFSVSAAAAAPAEEEEQTDEEKLAEAEKELSDAINDQLKQLELGGLEEILKGLGEDGSGIFGGGSFTERVEKVLSGDFSVGFDSVLAACFSLVFSDLLKYIPVLAAIVGIVILSGMLSTIKLKSGASVENIVHLACYGVIIALVFACVIHLTVSCKSVISSLQTQMNIALPALLTIMTALGASASAAVYQPAVAALSGIVSQLLTYLILPMFLLSLVLNLVGNISSNVKIGKTGSLIQGASKWALGFVFSIFTAFLTVQGITAGSYDGVSVRTAKYALSHYIPVIGGYLSEGFNIVMAGSMLVKNAVGMTGILLLAATVIGPVLEILVFSLVLRLAAAIVEPIGDSRVCDFMQGVSKSLGLLTALLLGTAFLYFIVLVLIICTGNFALYGG